MNGLLYAALGTAFTFSMTALGYGFSIRKAGHFGALEPLLSRLCGGRDDSRFGLEPAYPRDR